MARPTFAETGFLARIPRSAQITRYQVVGERSSGTNFAKRLLGRNTDLRPSEDLGWKHGFPHSLAIPPDMMVIGIVRDAGAWARSMHSKPWHTVPAMQELDFSDFIRAPWETIVDRRGYFDNAGKLGVVGQPLQHDRHPITGKRFENLFALRQAKLSGLLSYMERDCAFVLLRLERLIETPEAYLDQILDAVGAPARTSELRPVLKRLGAKFNAAIEPRPATPKSLSAEDHAFMRAHLDLPQEAALGYTYD